MKTIANRLIVFAAGALALSTVAFGQTRMTAEIPFSFHTVSGTLPPGTYSFDRIRGVGLSQAVVLTNSKTKTSVVAGNPMFDSWHKSPGAPVVVFACTRDVCALKAIRTSEGTSEYAVPHNPGRAEVAEISVPLKTLSVD